VAVRQLLAARQAREVKTIGDALMLRTGDAAAEGRLGLCILGGWSLLTAATPAAAGAVAGVEVRERGRRGSARSLRRSRCRRWSGRGAGSSGLPMLWWAGWR
jgi:hypothetical protein